jgi:hypothetical protein
MGAYIYIHRFKNKKYGAELIAYFPFNLVDAISRNKTVLCMHNEVKTT